MAVHFRTLAAGLAAGVSLAACSAGTGTIAPTQAKINGNVLELAVGTANIYGDLGSSGSSTGLNVVTTFRQPAGALNPGASAVLVSTPTLTGPFTTPATAAAPDSTSFDATSTVVAGPAAGEAGTGTIGGTAQNTTGVSSFGTSGGAFGLGLEPFNYGLGTPASAAPYPVPLFDASIAGDVNSFTPWGGPPAFDLGNNGLSVVGSSVVPTGYAGLSEGLDVFAGVAPRTGSYALSALIPANVAQPTLTATATLGSTALLPAVTPPTLTFDGSGGGTLSAVLPSPITEAYLQVTDLGPVQPTAKGAAPVAGCNGADAAPIYYTVKVTAGAPSGSLPDAIGPAAAPTTCTAAQNAAANTMRTSDGTAITGDQIVLQTVAFDYPLYEASYTSGKSVGAPAPTLTGTSGQSDVSISSAGGGTIGAAAAGSTLRTTHVTRRTIARKTARR